MKFKFNPALSISASLVLPIVLMGVLSMVMVMVTTEIYRNHIFNDQKNAISELVRLEAEVLINENLSRTNELTFSLIDPDLKTFFEDKDAEAITDYLDSYFNRYFVTAGVVQLIKISAFDKDFNLITHSRRGLPLSDDELICPQQSLRANQRTGASRLASDFTLCTFDQRPYQSVISAIGGLRTVGYIQTVTSPVPLLEKIESNLGFPICIHQSGDSTPVFESKNWPKNKFEVDDFMVVDTNINTSNDDIAYTISTSRDMRKYFTELRNTRNNVIFIAALLTLILSFLAHSFMRHSTINPILNLMKHAQKVSDKDTGLDEQITLHGATEIKQLSDSFNKMTKSLSQLYNDVCDSNVSLADEIIERKTVADELQHAHDQLTDKVTELNQLSRHLQQANQRLITENVQRVTAERLLVDAESASKAKSKFITSMSHELRTPLNVIIGFSQLMNTNDNIDDKTKDMADKIYKAGKHLLHLINEILDLSMIESGKMELTFEQLNLHELLDECLRLLTPLADKSDVTLDLSACECSGTISADRVRLKQVILNLMSNAIKYNKTDGSVNLCCGVNSEDNFYVTIRDTGPGIEPSRLNELFEPFNRLGKETGRIEGTGIGLVVTKELVEMMGLRLEVESKLGEGSTFSIVSTATDATPAETQV